MNSFLITGSSGLFGINFYHNFNFKNTFFLVHKKNIKIKNKVNLNLFNKKEIEIFLKKKKIKYVIHAAGLTNIDFIEKFKKKSYKNNYLVTKNISEACSKIKTKLIFISTDQLFSDNKKKYSEKSKIKPMNYYGYLKGISEKKILETSKNNLIIRTNFFGIGPNYRKSFSDFIVDNLKEKKKINLVSDVKFSPVYVITLIKFILKLIKSNETGIFNISSDNSISKYKFGLKICKIFNLDKKYIIETKLKNLKLTKRPLKMQLSNLKIKKKFKYKKINLDDEIIKLKNDYKKIQFKKIIKLK